MDQVLKGLCFTYAYIDNILVASANMDNHQQHPEGCLSIDSHL